MLENKEISALFHLIDDPDEEVFSTVTDRIISHGRAIIPNLENLWENSPDEVVQERIEMVIHKLHFRDLTEEFTLWKNGSCELLQGAMLASRYSYPELIPNNTLQEIEKIRRNIWLELNSYLTPLEQVNVISGILYSYYKLKGNEVSYDVPDDFIITKLIENKRGNAITNGVLYLILCEMLDIPVKAINIPKQFILGYFDVDVNFPIAPKQKKEKINFYIDPQNGQVYSHKDVESYFKRISVPPTPSYYRQLNNKRIIQHLLEEFSKCFLSPDSIYKKNDLIFLAKLLDD
ncbi:MAG: transglutaminase-like domain-containing protein [Bacteroidota bacterium]|jgi:regulator of sirC expression with transglutaminase-like and TPR domain|nr:transglutaminase-like domain-containing protein [Bacteroidota bacterium]